MPLDLWLFLAGLGAGLTAILPYLARRYLRDVVLSGPESWPALIFNLGLIGVSAALMVVGTIKAYTPEGSWLWWTAGAILIVVLAGYGYIAIRGETDYHLLTMVVVAMALAACIFVSVAKALDDNPYRVERGQVVGQAHNAASTTMTCNGGVCTPIFTAEEWTLTIRDCVTNGHCVHGVLHFNTPDVHQRYPVGSNYP